MGGGAAMRAAAKVAGVGVINSGIRGGFSVAPSPAEQSMRNVSMPVSAILSSSQSGVDRSEVQRPAFELDEWEFAGAEDELFIESTEPMPRVVFGGPPSLKEAKEATSDLKDALENVYMSSPNNMRSDGFGSGHLSGLSMLSNSDELETKGCITDYTRANTSPIHAIKAFKFLNESPEAQTVVASIASDPNVWEAVLRNAALQELLQQKTAQSSSDSDLQSFTDEASQTEETESKPVGWFENVKQVVSELVNDATSIVQQFFGIPTAEDKSSADEGDSGPFSFDKAAASFLALAVMAIVIVVLKRP